MKTAAFLFTLNFLLSGFISAQQTYVPDDNFEHYLETHDAVGHTVAVGDASSMGNGVDYDDYVLTSRINQVNIIDVRGLNIADLTGIEDFVALQELWCGHNQLTHLDLSQNTALKELACGYNQLNSLNISQNTALENLYCFSNPLGTLNITHNTSLVKLNCSEDQLADLDISQNVNLEELTCSLNQLTALDISHNVNLKVLDCKLNQINNLNISFNTGLISLDIEDNHISNLDISQNANLWELYCRNNQLNNLDVSHNPNLHYLYCYNNQITTLSITNNPLLIGFLCFNNHLNYLDLRNGHNTTLTNFDAKNNPDLTCVFVDDKVYMTNHWPNAIDSSAHYVETQAECDALHLDENFEALIKVYPNPFRNYLNIEVPDKTRIKTISLENIQGQRLYQSEFLPSIDLNNLTAGVYFLSIESQSGQQAVFKLVKE